MTDWPHLTGKLAPKVIGCLPLASMSAAELERIKVLLVEIDRMEQRGLKAEALTREAQQDVANLDKQCSEIALNHGREIERLLVEIDRMEEVPNLQVLQIPGGGKIDPICAYWHNVTDGKGYVTITCWGCAWTAYFGGMGLHNIQSFFASADVPYLVGKLGNTQWLKASKKHDVYLGRIVSAVQAALGGKDGKR